MKYKHLFAALLLGLSLTVVAWGSLASGRLAQAAEDAGYYVISVRTEGRWQTVGTLVYDKQITTQALDLSYLGLSETVQVRVEHRGSTAAHIDTLQLDGRPPAEVRGTTEGSALALHKLATRDNDLIDAGQQRLTFLFTATSGRVLSLAARIEPGHISTIPFQFPLSNLYLPLQSDSDFYVYTWNSRPGDLTLDGDLSDEALGTPFFKEFSRTGTGHPANYTYGWVRNDDQTLYVALDFTPDNTMDGDKDYAKVYVNTPAGLREFKASVPEQRWGQPGFTYTPRVAYQHKVYEFAIPLAALGLESLAPGDPLPLAFAAYGTAAPAAACFVEATGDNVTDFSSADASALQTAVDAWTSLSPTVKVAGTCAGVQNVGGYIQTLYINKSDITIQGGYTETDWLADPDPDTYPTTLSAEGAGRVVFVPLGGGGATNVVLDSLNITQGDSYNNSVGTCGVLHSNGGGGLCLANANGFTLLNSRVYNNVGINGGGLYRYGGNAPVVISNSTIYDNVSANGSGGGIYQRYGELALYNSTVRDNRSRHNGGGIDIYLHQILIEDSLISGNTTSTDGGGLSSFDHNQVVIELIGSQLINNTAQSEGGGLYHRSGSAFITDTLLMSNTAVTGGGIYNSGALTATRSPIAGNLSTGNGAGMANVAAALLINSTVSGNQAQAQGGGLYQSSGATPELSVIHTTITGNSSGTGGDGLYLNAGPAVFTNSLVTGNGTENCAANTGSFSSSGYNLEDADTCNFAQITDLTNTVPLLGSLADNGGDTQTHALLSGSPAIDAIPTGTNGCGDSYTEDQRGVSRPLGLGCDIGAYEADPSLTLTKTVTPTTDVAYHGIVTYTINLSNSGASDDTGVLLTDTLPGEVTFGGFSGADHGASVVDDKLTWTGDITADQSLTWVFTATHTGAYGDNVTNTAQFAGTLQADQAEATFTVEPLTYTLMLNTAGDGSGSVTADPDQTSYDSGTVVTLTATPDTGSTFAGWSGDLTGTTSPITVTMTAAKVITATFSEEQTDIFLPLILKN